MENRTNESLDTSLTHSVATQSLADILGHIEESTAFRICSMIDRCYVQDLELLKNFSDGTQGDNTPIAETLLSVGFLSNGGIDGGSWGEEVDEDSGGVIYNMNEYGKMFVNYALSND